MRIPTAPDIPTMNESGFPGFEAIAWFGLGFPAGTPADIVSTMNARGGQGVSLAGAQAEVRSGGHHAAADVADAIHRSHQGRHRPLAHGDQRRQDHRGIAVGMDADFVIIGGGTAGCVLANRLSADPGCQVVVVEAGAEATSPWISMPAGVAKLFHHPRLNWRYQTEPEPSLGGRRLYWPRGKVLGGTSSINGMTFVRGQAADYDSWSGLTAGAWSWRTVLPYFKRIEDSPFGTRELRGTGGPLQIGPVLNRHPLSEAFLRASVAAGVAQNDDYNGATQEGVGYTQVMMRGGVRSSAASAYLAPVRDRPNLKVLTDSPVRRVLVENGRAAGVELERNGSVETIRARREVLLCGGTIASPQLLLLSGIGDAGALAALGIPVNVDLPAVGRNLQEHVRAQLVYRTKVPSFNRDARGAGLAVQVARYALRKQGLLAVTASQVNGFVRSVARRRSPRPADRVPAVERRLCRGTLHRSRLPGRDGNGRFASTEEPRPCRAALGGSSRRACHRHRPPHRCRGLRSAGSRRRAHAQDLRDSASLRAGAGRSAPGEARRRRRVAARIHSRYRGFAVSRRRHLCDGRRRGQRDHARAQRSWRRRASGRRCIGHATRPVRKHDGRGADDRGARIGPDPRPGVHQPIRNRRVVST